MATHTSATARKEKSHTVDASLKRRARLLITNRTIPVKTRSLIRYALEINDPDLAQVVQRVEIGEMTIDTCSIPETLPPLCVFGDVNHRDSHRRREADLTHSVTSEIRMQTGDIKTCSSIGLQCGIGDGNTNTQ